MTNNDYAEQLCCFGLTRQEAAIYEALLSHGEMTGYEAAKATAISRSNAYAALSALVEKGAAYLIEGDATKYTPVDIRRFTANTIAELKEKAEYLAANAPEKAHISDGYITISGARNIRNKIREMLEATELRLYMLAPGSIIRWFEAELKALATANKKVVLLTDSFELDGAKIYKIKPEEGQLRLITDSSYVLTGELTDRINDTCLYSAQKNLIEVMKEALKNKIILLEDKR